MAKATTQDRVIILSDDTNEIQVLDIEKREGGNLYCDGLIVPAADASDVRISEDGRVYLYNCSLGYINEIQHLAQVEENIVLNKALHFRGDEDVFKKKTSFFQWVVTFMIFIVVLVGVIL